MMPASLGFFSFAMSFATRHDEQNKTKQNKTTIPKGKL